MTWACLNLPFYPGLDQASLLDRIHPFVGDFELCNSADLIHAQTATLHTKGKENKKLHHMTTLMENDLVMIRGKSLATLVMLCY